MKSRKTWRMFWQVYQIPFHLFPYQITWLWLCNIAYLSGPFIYSLVNLLSTGIGEAHLVVEWASQADTGIYLCHASSAISSSPPISTAIIVTRKLYIHIRFT